MAICQVGLSTGVWAEEGTPAEPSISDAQKAAIVDHCTTIIDDLKKVQKDDSRARVYLGGYYETILSKFIIPLNVRLVENNLSSAKLVENQNEMANTKLKFTNDFVDYQKELETLVGMDCKSEPEAFYQKLVAVRKKRKTVASETQKIRSIIDQNIQLVKEVRGKLWKNGQKWAVGVEIWWF